MCSVSGKGHWVHTGASGPACSSQARGSRHLLQVTDQKPAPQATCPHSRRLRASGTLWYRPHCHCSQAAGSPEHFPNCLSSASPSVKGGGDKKALGVGETGRVQSWPARGAHTTVVNAEIRQQCPCQPQGAPRPAVTGAVWRPVLTASPKSSTSNAAACRSQGTDVTGQTYLLPVTTAAQCHLAGSLPPPSVLSGTPGLSPAAPRSTRPSTARASVTLLLHPQA